MVADGVCSSDGKQFVDGADATRKGDKYITLIFHHLFTITEIVAQHLNIYIIRDASTLLNNPWNHAYGSSTSFMRSFTHTLH